MWSFLFPKKFKKLAQDSADVSLANVQEGKIVFLSSIKGHWNFQKQLSRLGFIPNDPIRVVKNSQDGPMVVEVKGCRLAIGRNEAQKILVHPNKIL